MDSDSDDKVKKPERETIVSSKWLSGDNLSLSPVPRGTKSCMAFFKYILIAKND